MTSSPARRVPDALSAVDAALVDAVASPPDDLEAPYDLVGLADATGTTTALLEAIARSGFLLPHHIDGAGSPRYSAMDAAAVEAGLTLLDSGLPLDEFLELASATDTAIATIADAAVEAFLHFVRDPTLGALGVGDLEGEAAAGARLLTAYERMLPATERLVAHHLRRRLLHRALERLADPRPHHPPVGSEPRSMGPEAEGSDG